MTDGKDVLIHYDPELVASILLSFDHPVMETELLRLLKEYHSDDQTLFQRHFSLYHVLYRLSLEMGQLGYYLHRDCMRIRLIGLPLNGCCHYNSEKGHFCGMTIPSGDEGSVKIPYCRFHDKHYRRIECSVSWDPLMDFYLNEENIKFGETDLFRKIREGIMVYAFKKGEVERSLNVFGLEKPSRKLIESRYRELAMKYHPDRGGDEKIMSDINSAYNVLCEVFIV